LTTGASRRKRADANAARRQFPVTVPDALESEAPGCEAAMRRRPVAHDQRV